VTVALMVMPVAVLVLGRELPTGSGPETVSSTLFLIVSLVALGLGALGASEQFADRSVHFLFTKPRSRAYFIWANWAVGCAELAGVALVNILAGWAILTWHAKAPSKIELWQLVDKQHVAQILVYCLLLYCLTYALTAALRNGLYGLGAGILSIAVYQAAGIAAERWRVHLPVPAMPIGSLSPVLSGFLWTLLALSFVFVAQFVIERVEL